MTFVVILFFIDGFCLYFRLDALVMSFFEAVFIVIFWIDFIKK